MDIVLGVSMTPTTVRMVLVEGAKADGLTVDHDSFDVAVNEGSATRGRRSGRRGRAGHPGERRRRRPPPQGDRRHLE